jgi:hypothetical protein
MSVDIADSVTTMQRPSQKDYITSRPDGGVGRAQSRRRRPRRGDHEDRKHAAEVSVYGISSFYDDLLAPRGARHVRVCTGTACWAATGGAQSTPSRRASSASRTANSYSMSLP